MEGPELDLSGSGQGQVTVCCEQSNETLGFMKHGGEFVDHMTNYWLSKVTPIYPVSN